jgi:hypothetical protein
MNQVTLILFLVNQRNWLVFDLETEDEYESDTYSTYSSEDEPDYSESDLEDETFRQKSNWKDVSKVETVRLGNDKKTLYAIVRW